jgi:prepilin-type N-terminal cleavage/methylation domain-containing protein
MQPRQRAFTLVELLVTIAIIAILASMLLHAIQHAKARARSITCMNNLRQMTLAWHQYATDAGELANNVMSGQGGKSAALYNWVGGWMDYAKNNSENTNTWNLIDGQFGKIGAYAQNAAIYKCPNDRSTAPFGMSRLPRVRSYSLNYYVGARDKTWSVFYFTKLDQMIRPGPANTIAFIEEHEDSINDGAFYQDPNATGPGGAWYAFPGARHGLATWFSFADGHTELKRWKLRSTIEPVLSQWRFGQQAVNSPDVDWFASHMTAWLDK